MARTQRKSLIIILFVLGCLGVKAQLAHGDLLFVAARNSQFERAISASSVPCDTAFSHVAILDLSRPQIPQVIEAVPEHGVHSIPFADFLSQNYNNIIVVKRVDNQIVNVKDAVLRARNLIGRAYDFAFLPDNEQVYCAELVWLCYLDNVGNKAFVASPMRFVDPKESPGYWSDYYAKLNLPIPEGVGGTHPSKMALSPLLYPVNFRLP